jgi:sortase A
MEEKTMKNEARRKLGTALSLGGLALVIFALGIWGYNVWDDKRAGDAADEVVEKIDTELNNPDNNFDMGETPLYIKYPEVEMPIYTVDGHDYIGRIDIPDLEISLPIMSEWSYPNLKIAPCRYSGSAYQKIW